MTHTLKIEFSNQEALKHFATWLCEMGEQDYWTWMEYREQEEEKGDITARQFIYHHPQDENFEHNDESRYRDAKFLNDNTIHTVCGRLSDES